VLTIRIFSVVKSVFSGFEKLQSRYIISVQKRRRLRWWWWAAEAETGTCGVTELQDNDEKLVSSSDP